MPRKITNVINGVNTRFSEFLAGVLKKGRVVDALTEEGDERRGIAAICFGEVLSNL